MASFTSTQAGDWQTPATWGETVEYPGKSQEGDIVTIGSGHDVTWAWDNKVDGYSIEKITTSAAIIIDTTMDTYMLLDNNDASTQGLYLNNANGQLKVGDSTNALPAAYTFTLEFISYTNGGGNAISGNGGQCLLYGTDKTYKGITTNSIAASGTSFTMTTVPSDWAADDELVILPTGNTYSETDYVDITSISGTTVNIDATTYSHLSGATVLNLTRNIIFTGDITNTTRPQSFINMSNGGYRLNNMRISNCYSTFNSASYGAFRTGNQAIATDRPMEIINCVADNSPTVSGFLAGQGYHHHKNCISVNNYYGQGGSNDVGNLWAQGCYYVDNLQDGFYPSNRGYVVIEDCVICGNGDDGLDTAGTHMVMINCQSYANAGYGVYANSSPVEMYTCLIGESDVGTQTNVDADFYFTKGARVLANDCKFSSADLEDIREGQGFFMNSSNHNQVENASKVTHTAGSTIIGEVSRDASVYRTTAPSVKLESYMMWGQNHWSFPIKVDSGDVLSVEIYGKSSASSGWETNPSVRILGCGIDDSDEWEVADTNWNAVTLNGTASRGGIVNCSVFWGDNTLDFNLDDISITVT